jgi:acyl-homoserine-lactone acylase
MQRATLLLAAALLTGCGERAQPPPQRDTEPGDFAAEIRWTSFGIPHVKADDWAGLGYGFAYATAVDAVCVIARDLAMVNGDLSHHFGADDGNVASDVFHRAVLTDARIAAYDADQSVSSHDFARGYVAGYNRYLRDHADALPTSCAGADWVRPMTAEDMVRLTIGVAIRYGLGRFQREMAAAAPPAPGSAGPAATDSDHALISDLDGPTGFGSNAVALGRAASANGRGVLFGNPHYPWRGSSRFHLIHTTIPGEVDVMGVSLLTTGRVSIGFNRDVAWTHTVSTALRATLYQLELHPDDPLRYRYGDDWRPLEAVTVDVPDDGRHTVYFSHYGPVVTSAQLPWTAANAYTVRDVNLDNHMAAATYDALNKARSIDDVEAAISRQGVAWTNTIAADRHGTAFYADISVAPNVDAALLDRCRLSIDGLPNRMVVLNGAAPDCEWGDDAATKVPGALPAGAMPRLRRDDYVSNSNDSYWLSNPDAPLEGYSPIIGDEQTTRSLRTRAGLTFIQEALDAHGRIGPDHIQAMLDSQRNYGAELLLDDLLPLCETPPMVELDGRAVPLAPACAALAAWDRRMTVDSRGGHVWREFWRDAQNIPAVFAVPFDPTDPVGTPRQLAVGDDEVRAALLQALAGAQVRLEDAGIALDARLGDIQYTEANGERLPIPGGEGWAGMWSMIIAALEPGRGYTPIIHGNSYLQFVTWNDAGDPEVRGMLTYSQSPEPDSPHHADLTRLHARGEWVRLPFTEAEIAADPELVTLPLSE